MASTSGKRSTLSIAEYNSYYDIEDMIEKNALINRTQDINRNLSLIIMDNVNALNDIKKSRMDLLRQLETLMKLRSRRDTYLSTDLNKRIQKLEDEIHKMTIKHRAEIKKCYSGIKTPLQ